MMGTVSRVMAGCFSMAAFSVAIIAGLTSGNPATLVLGRALMAMILCYPVGYIVGIICERVIAIHTQQYEQQHPLPDDHEDESDSSRESAAPSASQESQEEVLTV